MMGRAIAVAVVVALTLTGCGVTHWFSSEKQPLPGERISVLSLDRRLEPDPELAKVPITLPPARTNVDWPQSGGDAAHLMGRLALPARLARVWQVSVGDGSSRYTRIMAQPVVAHDRVFAMDGGVQVGAWDAANGTRLWQVDLKPEGEQGNGFGGGVAWWQGRLYAATGYGQIVALNPNNGKVIWRVDVPGPVHAAPTVAEGRVFAVTLDNELIVVSTKDGKRLWTHSGIPETAGLLGGASPAVSGEIVVVPYSSGELYGLTVESGRQLWSDNLATTRTVDAVSALADIRGRPVIDRDRAFAISHSGRMVAIDMRRGDQAWEQEIGSSHGPWVAGDYVFVLADDNELLCLTRNEGKVRWVRQLPRWGSPKSREDPIEWAGPVLGGDRLIVLSSQGKMMSLAAETGKPIGDTQSLADADYVDPIIAGGTLYVLTDDGTLTAYR
jgi:outer membrane protein assembly factor BamB